MKISNILNPRESSELISKQCQHITLNQAGVDKTAQTIYQSIRQDDFGMRVWDDHDLNPKTRDQAAVDWIFFVDTVNFSFWPEEGDVKFGVKDKHGDVQTGYWSICAAVNRALALGIPVTSAEFMANATEEHIQTIFKSSTEGEIPLLKERLKAINDAGKVLLERFNGSFTFCVMRAERDVNKLLDLVVDNFSSYQDICEYKGSTVSFLKRAQILIGDIWTCFKGEGLGKFSNIEEITMFADYRVPQAMVAFGVLDYSDYLKQILHNGARFNPGDELECEIRGMSILGCDRIAEGVKWLAEKDGVEIVVNSIIVDYFLWEYARAHRDLVNKLPFHRCRTIYY